MTSSATDSIAHELYGLLPSEFIAARNAAARELGAGDREIVKALPKPSTAAWVVNLLVRQRADQVEKVLELGAQLRQAQGELDRDALAELSRQRRALVRALAQGGAALAEVVGHPVSNAVVDDVAQTLQAGMSDADAAGAVRSGVLVRALEVIGLSVDLEGAVAAGPLARSPRSAVVDDLEEKRAQRRAREAEAQRAIEAAESAHEKAERAVADAVRHRDALADRAAEAAAALKQLRAELVAAEKELKAASSARDDAASAAERARASVP